MKSAIRAPRILAAFNNREAVSIALLAAGIVPKRIPASVRIMGKANSAVAALDALADAAVKMGERQI